MDASVHGRATLLPLPKRRIMSAVCKAIPRNEFFAVLYILGCANGLLGRMIQSFQFSDWEGALAGADINVIMLFACFAGISLVSAKSPEHLLPRDMGVAIIFLILVSLPIFPLSWVAVTALSLYILVFANANPERVRGALILLALTAPTLIGRRGDDEATILYRSGARRPLAGTTKRPPRIHPSATQHPAR